MSDTITATVVENTETITATIVDGGDTIIAHINELARGPAGPPGEGGGGSGAITSETTSDGTADLDLLNVDTVNATVTGTLTASHIHGNLAGNVYGHIRAGENLAKGDPVYVSGFHGSGSTLIPIVSKADASNAAKMPAIGIMDAAVANNATGHMVIVGTITELNTNAYTVNAELYVASGGGFTATPPTARAQPVARVERANTNNGAVIVKVNGLSATDATANTLVRRNANGDASFAGASFSGLIDAGDFTANGTTGEVVFGSGSQIAFDGISYTYGAGSASAHRTSLGIGTSDAPTFLGTNITGTASLNINGTVGATTPTTGAFTTATMTTLSYASTLVISRAGVTKLTLANAGASFAMDARPETTNAYDLGISGFSWRNLFLAGTANIGGIVSISSSTASTTTGTGALVVTGGVGVGGAVSANSINTTSVKPFSDSATAIRVFKADGTTPIQTWDTTNGTTTINTSATDARSNLIVKSASGRGLSLNGEWPGFGLNTYYTGTQWKSVSAGWCMTTQLDSSGVWFISMSGNAVSADANISNVAKFYFYQSGGLFIGTSPSDPGAGSIRATNAVFSGTLAVTGAATFSAAAVFASFTVGTVPSAATFVRGMIYVSNESGGATLAYSNGTNWKRVYDNENIS